MKMHIRIGRALALLVIVMTCSVLTASAKTFYGRVTVIGDAEKGLVYVSDGAAPSEDDYAVSVTQDFSQEVTGLAAWGSNTNITAHLYVQPKAGYKFDHWAQGSTTVTSMEPSIKISSTNSSSPTSFTYTAVFVEQDFSVVCSDPTHGTVTCDKEDPKVGESVTVSLALPHGPFTSEFCSQGVDPRPSKAIVFEGWYNADGEKVSDEMSFTYNIEKKDVLTARVRREFTIKVGESSNIHGYYRLQSPIVINSKGVDGPKFLCLTGNFKVSFNSKDALLEGALEFSQYPEQLSSRALSGAVYSEAGNIFYVTGKVKNSIESTSSGVIVAEDLVATAQGVSTETLAGSKFTMKTSPTAGYYYLIGGYVFLTGDITLQLTYGNKLRAAGDKAGNSSYEIAQDFDIQPVDREHVETNYFGPMPDASMEYDGGYWCTLYTAFPYECYEEDGVEAYVVNDTFSDSDGSLALVLTRLEEGVVPSATPVVLKCRGTSPKENRLIPLEPDDERISAAQELCKGNLLTGNYGLWTGVRTGRPTYDKSSMRVFGMNSKGQLGFFRMTEDGKELTPNLAYLADASLNAIAGASEAKSIRLMMAEDFSGVGSVSIERPEDEAVYDLYGRRVTEMMSGNIYIKNGKKVIYRE